MEQLFLKIMGLSVSATGLILAVIILRPFLKKVPKWITCMLWGLVGLRLIIPFHVETSIGLMPKTETMIEILSTAVNGDSENLLYEAEYTALYGQTGISATITDTGASQKTETDAQVNTDPLIGIAPANSFVSTPDSDEAFFSEWSHAFSLIWLAGSALMLLYLTVSYARLHNRLKTATLLRRKVKYTAGIKQSEYVNSPFILGLVKPYIYIPYHLEEETLTYVLAHEETHLRYRDHWLKMSAYLLLSVYWFHPLVWLAYVLFCRDLEFSCDERVINGLDENERRAYARALLHCGGKRLYFSTCPIGFGETGVRERIIRVKKFKKPSLIIVLLCMGLCALIAVCFITNPLGSAVSFANIQLEGASVVDLRTDASISYDLNDAEIEELTWRLKKLQIGQESKTPYEPSPSYSLTIKMQDSDLLILTGYESDEKYAVAFYQEKYYRIDDSEFCDYLNNVCVGNQRADAESQDAADRNITGYDSEEFAADTNAGSQSESSSTGTGALEIGIADNSDTGNRNENGSANTEAPAIETTMIGGISLDEIAYVEVTNGNNGQRMRFTDSDAGNEFTDLLNLYQQLNSSGNAEQNNRVGYNYCMRLYDQNDTLLQTVTPYKDGFVVDSMFYACDMTVDHVPVNLMNYIDLLFYPGVPEVEKARENLLFEILDELEGLTYRDETCDGIPEINLSGNGTEYQINLSKGWVWKDDREADLSEELARKIQTMLIMK